MKRGLRAASAFLALDIGAVVLSGGVSLLGPVTTTGFVARALLLLVLLAVDRRRRGTRIGYFVLLVLLVSLLHLRGYRLRGDGLWYYSFAHSLAFDGDIDLANQYQRLGIDHLAGSQSVRETGRARFTYPVGAPVLWVPFVYLGYPGAALRNAYGLTTAYNGFSDPFFHAVALGNLLLGWAGLLVLGRFLGKWFPPWVAFATSAGIGLGSFLAWYLAYHAIYTHAAAFLLVGVFLLRWSELEDDLRDYVVLGLLLGLATAVRWQNAVFCLLPAWTLLTRLPRREWRPILSCGAVFSAGLLVGVVPQLLSWKAIYDRLYVGVPLGADYMRWDNPFLSEILFSSRHGLFSWSPILLVAAVGYLGFLRRDPKRGFPLLSIFVLLWYINATVADWWGGGSFGARRFDSLLFILGLGLAVAIERTADFVGRHPRGVTAAIVALFVGSNLLLMEQYRKGRIPVDDTMSWQAASEAKLEDVFDWIGYPFSFPMNWLFALRYDRPMTQYDILVGKYLYHRMHDLSGVIDLGPSDPPFIGNGWSGLNDWPGRPLEVRFARGERAGLFVPLDRPESFRVIIECAAPEGTEPIPIEVRLNGLRLGGFLPAREMSEQVMTADRRFWKRLNLLELVPVRSADGAYLAVDRLRFERIESGGSN